MQLSFSVVRSGDGWTIVGAGRGWGRFSYQVDAEEAALRLAQSVIAGGRTAEVLVQNRSGEITRLKVA